MSTLKTNAMRQLDNAGIAYNMFIYNAGDGQIDGISVARKIGKPVEMVYKTLVTQGASREHFVYIIPVAEELDLKAAARAVGEKYVALIKVADINKVTGYIRGGCSPIGMKREYRTVLDESALARATIVVSPGKIGQQIELAPGDLLRVTKAATAKLVAG